MSKVTDDSQIWDDAAGTFTITAPCYNHHSSVQFIFSGNLNPQRSGWLSYLWRVYLQAICILSAFHTHGLRVVWRNGYSRKASKQTLNNALKIYPQRSINSTKNIWFFSSSGARQKRQLNVIYGFHLTLSNIALWISFVQALNTETYYCERQFKWLCNWTWNASSARTAQHKFSFTLPNLSGHRLS